MPKKWIWFVFLLICLCAGLVGVYHVPFFNERLSWRVVNWGTEIKRFLRPPEKIVFQPGGQLTTIPKETIVKATMDVLFPASSISSGTQDSSGTEKVGETILPVTRTASVTTTPLPRFLHTLSPTPIPNRAVLTGILHEWQKFNNCGPANLAMALSFWGWQGDQQDTRAYLRPNLEIDDKNVMPGEMVAFVEKFTSLRALVRVGGDLELIKGLIAAGFPVLIEEGHDPADDSWMGHYLVISGYDDTSSQLITQDSLLGSDLQRKYEDFSNRWWRDFNYVYIIIFPSEREGEVFSLLDTNVDLTSNFQSAAQRAKQETLSLTGRDQFFAWFNLGSSQVGLEDYQGAAQAYDTAFVLYAKLPEEERPYRLMWYQVGPYQSYYAVGRFQDVIDLANITLAWVTQPVLEETYYWRGMAYKALGDINRAIKDLQKAATINPNFKAPHQALESLGAPVP